MLPDQSQNLLSAKDCVKDSRESSWGTSSSASLEIGWENGH